MVDEVLAEEGITYTESSVMPGYNIHGFCFNYKKCSEILDQLAEIAGYVWYVDYEGVLHFKKPNSIGQGKKITKDIILDKSLQVSNKNNQYRNKQYVKGATAQTELLTQKFSGDGTTQSFTLGFRLAEKPKIWVNGE